MTATIIDGKSIANHIKQGVKAQISNMKQKPCLAIVMVGDHFSSKVYINTKLVTCRDVDILSRHLQFPATITEQELLQVITTLNNDPEVHAILVQLPLPSHLSELTIFQSISPLKDVDGFHPENVGLLQIGCPRFIPCTPKGILHLLKEYNITLSGKHAVIVGRSNIVGKPIATLLLQEHATITICHSKTVLLSEITRHADLLIVAVGSAGLITRDMVKVGAVVIDVGVNRIEDSTRPNRYGICGDAAENVREVAGSITPVPGGVGPMTIAMLLENVVHAAKLQGCL